MRLAPRVGGLAGLVDSLSHPLSLLAAVCPDPDATLGEIAVAAPSAKKTEVRFVYQTPKRTIEVEVALAPVPEPPRPAAYAFDGAWAHRSISMPEYAMTLHDGAGRRIPLPDPSRLLVGSLLERIAAGPPDAVDPALVPGMRHLVTLWRVARDVEFPPTS